MLVFHNTLIEMVWAKKNVVFLASENKNHLSVHYILCFSWCVCVSAIKNSSMAGRVVPPLTKAKVKGQGHKYSFSVRAQCLKNMYTKYEHFNS